MKICYKRQENEISSVEPFGSFQKEVVRDIGLELITLVESHIVLSEMGVFFP